MSHFFSIGTITGPFRRFFKDETGTGLVEFLIVLPLLIWAWVGMFAYWDVFKSINKSQKASYIISDSLSRTAGQVTPGYIDGLEKLLAYLSQTDDEVQLRVSSIGWDPINEAHTPIWSYSPEGEMTPLDEASVALMSSRLPEMVEFETLILVETRVDYVQPLGVAEILGLDLGIGSRTLTEFIPISPRFVEKVCLQLEGSPCAEAS
jgi:hypothetical protein